MPFEQMGSSTNSQGNMYIHLKKKKKKGTEGMNTSQKYQHLSVSSLEHTNPWLGECVGAELNSLKKIKTKCLAT